MRSLDDLYKVTNSIDEVTLYYHLVVSYGVWRSNKRLKKMENCYGWEDCINWE
jgi:hypothetical protein